MDKILLINKANGIESYIDKELWDKLDDKSKRPFDVKIVKAPKEVLEMEANKAPEPETETTETAQISNETEKTTETKPETKTRPKRGKNNTGNN